MKRRTPDMALLPADTAGVDRCGSGGRELPGVAAAMGGGRGGDQAGAPVCECSARG